LIIYRPQRGTVARDAEIAEEIREIEDGKDGDERIE